MSKSAARRMRPHRSLLLRRQVLVNILLFGGVLYIFGRQFDGIFGSITALRQADMTAVAAATALVGISYLVAALSYQALALKPLRYASTLSVQVASGFVNRLLPAGLGSLGIFADYYRKHGHSLATASVLVTKNNLLGIVGNVVLLMAVLLLHPAYASQLRLRITPDLLIVSTAGVTILAVGLLVWRLGWLARPAAFIGAMLVALRRDLRVDRRTIVAFICNVTVTSLNVFVLSLAITAAGGELDWSAALIALSFGTLVGAAAPTPGGIGAVETGLLAALLAFGVAASVSLAAVLLYRGLTYWLPIIPGIIAFRIIEKRLL